MPLQQHPRAGCALRRLPPLAAAGCAAPGLPGCLPGHRAPPDCSASAPRPPPRQPGRPRWLLRLAAPAAAPHRLRSPVAPVLGSSPSGQCRVASSRARAPAPAPVRPSRVVLGSSPSGQCPAPSLVAHPSTPAPPLLPHRGRLRPHHRLAGSASIPPGVPARRLAARVGCVAPRHRLRLRPSRQPRPLTGSQPALAAPARGARQTSSRLSSSPSRSGLRPSARIDPGWLRARSPPH